MARIKAIVDILHSERDMSGNVYWAFRFTDVRTGKSVQGLISGDESNITEAMCAEIEGGLPFKSGEVHTTTISMPKRAFKDTVGSWPYAGCPPAEIANFIRKGLRKRARR